MKGEPLCVSSNRGSGTCRDSLNVARTYLLIGFPKVRRILNYTYYMHMRTDRHIACKPLISNMHTPHMQRKY